MTGRKLEDILGAANGSGDGLHRAGDHLFGGGDAGAVDNIVHGFLTLDGYPDVAD